MRVREVIKRHFGIEFCRSHVWHILTNHLGWTAKRPVQELKNRNDAEIAEWETKAFPRILRDAFAKKASLAFIDETGFMMYPTIRKTFSPRGETPINKVTDPHGRISTIGAITVSPIKHKLRWHYHTLNDDCNFRGPAVVAFLEQLSGEISAPVIVIWDQIIIHSCHVVKEYLRTNARMTLRSLPAYVPELNPVDRAWFYIKYNRIPNFTPSTRQQLRKAVERELKYLTSRADLLRSFIESSTLPQIL